MFAHFSSAAPADAPEHGAGRESVRSPARRDYPALFIRFALIRIPLIRFTQPAYWKIWNSETCPAGHPVLAVKFSRTYRVVVEAKVIVTVLPVDGLKV